MGRAVTAIERRPTVIASLAILAVILLVALGLRLYRLPELTEFQGDQARDAMVVDTMLETGQPVLLGPAVSTGVYQRGPAFYYVLAPGLFLAGGDPVGGAVLTALADVATVLLLAVVGRMIGGWPAGLVAAAIWATGALTVTMGRFAWNPQWIPALALLCMLALILVDRGRPRWFLVVWPSLAIAWQMHDQAVLLGLAVLVWWVIVRPPVPRRIIAGSIGLGVLVTLPFLAYEATHGMANLVGMIAQVIAGRSAQGAGLAGIGEQARALVGAARQFMPGGPALELALWLTSIIGLAFCLRRVGTLDDPAGPLLLVIVAAIVPVYLLWPGGLLPHYMYVVWVAVALFVGFGVAWLLRLKRPIGVIAGAVVVVVAIEGAVTTMGDLRDQPALGRGTLASAKALTGAIIDEGGDAPFAVRILSAGAGRDLYDGPLTFLLRRANGPSTGRVDLPTVLVVEPSDQAFGTASGGRVVADRRLVTFPAPDLAEELIVDGDVATPSGISPRWGGPQTQVETGSSEGRGHVRIVTDLDHQPIPDGPTISQAIDVDGPGRYLVGFEARTHLTSGTGRVIAEAVDPTGGHLAVAPTDVGAILPAGPDWSPGSFFLDAPEGTARLIISLRNAGVGDIDIRGVTVRRVVSDVLPGDPIY
jgi:hypothetical protein